MSFLRYLGGIIFLMAIIYLVVMMFQITDGVFLPTHWVAFYVSVALVTGVSFWIFTESEGEFSWHDFGIKLGGGAAIGAAFMFFADYLTPPAPPHHRIITMTVPGIAGANPASWTGGIQKVTRLEPQNLRFLVEFKEGQHEGELTLKYLNRDGVPYLRKVNVPRVGELPDALDEPIASN